MPKRDKVTLTVDVPDGLRRRVKMAAAAKGTTMTAAVEIALTNWCEAMEKDWPAERRAHREE